MNEEKRIKEDIELFHSSIKEIKIGSSKAVEEIVKLARNYCEDAEFYLKKKDYVTAFGCINYAHGLLDAVKKISK
jgi:hypothetical protein